jgi:phytoene/squalene synthetase
MEMDLYNGTCNERQYNEYIYGSAEVVGLMCLQVFCEGDRRRYAELEPYARALGAAFQKVNFLRDMKADYISLSRCYFPGVDFMNFDENNKREIVDDINSDFRMAYKGIISLPWKVKFGVYVAYKYYLSLFNKIKRTQAANIVRQRIRIPNFQKAMILAKAGIRSQLKLI